jgi:hypothetical protein
MSPTLSERCRSASSPLTDADWLQIETTMAVLAVGRRHLSEAEVRRLLFGLTEAELAVGVVNSRVANLRRAGGLARALRDSRRRARI